MTAPASECTVCPPWVIRCAHFEGKAVTLGYKRAWMDLHEPDCRLKNSITANMRLEEWQFFWPSEWWPCKDCGSPALTAVEAFHPPQYFTDLDAALEAFYETEARLLRGEL